MLATSRSRAPPVLALYQPEYFRRFRLRQIKLAQSTNLPGSIGAVSNFLESSVTRINRRASAKSAPRKSRCSRARRASSRSRLTSFDSCSTTYSAAATVSAAPRAGS